jgi:hypothetical protein
MDEHTTGIAPTERPPAIAPANEGAQGPPHLADPRALTILATEHWSLLSQRSLAWTETFARAGMFLATLSAATVALALVGSVMRDRFIVFALVVLPVVLFIGLATSVRLSQASADDGRAIQGMNRIRHAYLEMVPELQPYFVTSRYDDIPGIMVTIGAPPDIAARIAAGVGQPTFASVLGSVLHGFVTTSGMILVINCVIGAIAVALVAIALGAGDTAAVLAGLAGAVAIFVGQATRGIRSFARLTRQFPVQFPSPPASAT